MFASSPQLYFWCNFVQSRLTFVIVLDIVLCSPLAPSCVTEFSAFYSSMANWKYNLGLLAYVVQPVVVEYINLIHSRKLFVRGRFEYPQIFVESFKSISSGVNAKLTSCNSLKPPMCGPRPSRLLGKHHIDLKYRCPKQPMTLFLPWRVVGDFLGIRITHIWLCVRA